LTTKSKVRTKRDVAAELFDAALRRNIKAALDASDNHYCTMARQVVGDLQSKVVRRATAKLATQ
jgi:hypothetical protein